MINTDVVVIGAGPVGSTAAKHAALGGADVILLDKKAEIGAPKRCAEGVYNRGLKKLGIEPDSRWISQTIYGGVIHAPKGESIVLDEKVFPEFGYILERKVFDKHMAMDAARAGTKIMIKTRVIDLVRENDGFIITCESIKERFEIHAKIVIAADGPESLISRKVGFKTNTVPEFMMSCAQFEMVNVDKPRDDLLDFYFGENYASGGYAWIFPKGNGVANVGLGIRGDYNEKTAYQCLLEFIEKCPYTQNAQAVELNVGGVPIAGMHENIHDNNIMLCGDAAGQVDPIEGGGIILGMLGGMAAGQVAASSVEEENYSKEKLNEYPEKYDELTRGIVPKLPVVRDFILSLTDDDFDKMIHLAKDIDMKNVTKKELIKLFFKISPKTSLKFTKLINLFI